jgi:transcriptional regulator with XRE-family HTH domain
MDDKKRVIWNRFAEHLALKEQREGRRITQDTIVEETGISKQTVNSYLQNKREMYSMRVIDKLCEYLGVTPSDFFVWVNLPEKNSDDDDSKPMKTRLAIPA